jgi:hypothetical protein
LRIRGENGLGLSHGNTAAVLDTVFGLQVSRGGLAQAFQRVARKAESTYEELVQQIRGSPSVTPDETGWKVGGRLWRMWAFSSDKLTEHSIQPGRGYEQASTILAPDFDGSLVRNGWAVYRRFRWLNEAAVSHCRSRGKSISLADEADEDASETSDVTEDEDMASVA